MKQHLLRQLSRYRFSRFKKVSYAQCGEDLIIDFLLKRLGIQKPGYLDIGAYHPFTLSNTYLFYLQGGRGVTIEPDPTSKAWFQRYRPQDTHLNVAIGLANEPAKASFYVMSSRKLNTLSKEEAQRVSAQGSYAIEKTIEIDTLPVQHILESHFSDRKLDLLSLDVEGLDLDIARAIDFNKYRPAVCCVESVSFESGGGGAKNRMLLDFFTSAGYRIYADTHINTIFVDARLFDAISHPVKG